jgi:hypothetical protein
VWGRGSRGLLFASRPDADLYRDADIHAHVDLYAQPNPDGYGYLHADAYADTDDRVADLW